MTAREAPAMGRLAANLTEATKVLEEASRNANHARHAETNALNALNAAQKAFDEAVDVLRKGAAHGSDWHNQAHRHTGRADA